MCDLEEIDITISQCLQNKFKKEAQMQGHFKDLQDYFLDEKKDVPFKEFESMTEEEKKEFVRYLFNNNKLYLLHNKEIQYIILCSFLERGQILTRRVIRNKFGFVQKQRDENIGFWLIEGLNKVQDNSDFLNKLRYLNQSFKVYIEKSENCRSSENDLKVKRDSSHGSNEQFNSIASTIDSPKLKPYRLTFNQDTKKYQQFQNILNPTKNFKEDGVMNADVEQSIINLQKKHKLGADGMLTYELFSCLNQEIKAQDSTFEQIDQFLEQHNSLKPKCELEILFVQNDADNFLDDKDSYQNHQNPHTCFYCMDKINGEEEYFYGDSDTYNTETYVGKKVYFHGQCANIFSEKCEQLKNKKENFQWVNRSNEQWVAFLQKSKKQVQTIKDIRLIKPQHFICKNCSKLNQRDEQIICSSCGNLNEALANLFLTQK